MGHIVLITDKEGKTLLCFSCRNFSIEGNVVDYWGSAEYGIAGKRSSLNHLRTSDMGTSREGLFL